MRSKFRHLAKGVYTWKNGISVYAIYEYPRKKSKLVVVEAGSIPLLIAESSNLTVLKGKAAMHAEKRQNCETYTRLFDT